MKKTPLISVLVPVYNIERYIGLCLESIIRQTYRNLEIIVVDDGSTDRSGEICDLYAQKDDRIKIIHKRNGGLVSARKKAMNIAKGDYVGYVDGDDWIEEDFYSDLISSILKTDSDVVVTGFSKEIFSKTVKIENALPPGIYEGKKLETFYSSMISSGCFFRHGITTYLWNKLFKTEVIKIPQLSVDERISIGEDGAVVYPALLKCNRILVMDNHAYHYRQREDSMLKKTSSYIQEFNNLFVLYEYLKNSLTIKDEKFNLIFQVQKYLLSTFIVRSGGVLNDSIHVPFNKDIKGKTVVICGAGTFGQQLVKRIEEYNYCKIAAWVDDDYWEYRRCCLNVDPISSITDLKYDFVVIGMVDNLLAKKMKNRLIDCGISSSKVLMLSVNDEIIESYLNQYLCCKTRG